MQIAPKTPLPKWTMQISDFEKHHLVVMVLIIRLTAGAIIKIIRVITGAIIKNSAASHVGSRYPHGKSLENPLKIPGNTLHNSILL